MQVIVCIDDTDNRENKRGTGELADALKRQIEAYGWGKSSMIVRHQLYVHPDIPYTSHNSAMSFGLEIAEGVGVDRIASFSGGFLAQNSAEGSDPGLCVVSLPRLVRPEVLVRFGQEAKVKVLTQDYAYRVAEELGIHLSAHGGTGQGVIGALAGAGLRLSGNDGRVRGKHRIAVSGDTATVGEILLKAPAIDIVQTIDGRVLESDEVIGLASELKCVFLNGRSVLLVQEAEGLSGPRWQVCSKELLKQRY